MITPQEAKSFFTNDDRISLELAEATIDEAIQQQYENTLTEIKVKFDPPLRDRVLEKVREKLVAAGWKIWRYGRQGLSFAATAEPQGGGWSGCKD